MVAKYSPSKVGEIALQELLSVLREFELPQSSDGQKDDL